MGRVITLKRTFLSIYFLIAAIMLVFPLYYTKLEPTRYNMASDAFSGTGIWTGPYSYAHLLPMLILFSVVYWMIAGIILLTNAQEVSEK